MNVSAAQGPRVLIVGAGAVGVSFGSYLAHGGARVDVLVKPAHEAEARDGFRVYALRAMRKPRVARLKPTEVLTDPGQVAGGPGWDQVWLCVASPALYQPWLDELLRAIRDATLITFQPGLADRAHIEARYPAERLVHGVITLIAYQAPLEGEAFTEPGIACWMPPGSAIPFAGPPERIGPVIAALRAGGCPAKVAQGAPGAAAQISAAMMPTLLALESEGWSLSALARSPVRRVACQAADQATAIVNVVNDTRGPWWRPLVTPVGLRCLLALAPHLVPMPLEAYLAYHFTKVGAQTRQMVRLYRDEGRTRGLPVDAIEHLIDA